MRSLLFVLSAIAVIGLAFWAYRENYQTQEAQSEAERVQRQISNARERLRVLNAEWAYLNRPERLRDLADLNFKKLELVPLRAEQFGKVSEVGYPKKDLFDISDSVEVSNMEQFP